GRGARQTGELAAADPGPSRDRTGRRGQAASLPAAQPVSGLAELRGGPHRALPGARHRDAVRGLLLLQRHAVPDADSAAAQLSAVRDRLTLLFPCWWTPGGP